MSWQHFLALAGAHFLALLSPGPDFLLLLNHTLCYGRKAGYATALGIACANGVFILCALVGMQWLLHSQTAFLLGYWIGCSYLAWVGWQFWRSARAAGDSWQTSERSPDHRFFLRGFLSGVLNPKNALFYLTLFTVLASKDCTSTGRALAGIWMFAVVLCWDCLLSYWLTQSSNMAFLKSRQQLLHRSSALLLWGLAGSLLGAGIGL